MSGTEPTSQDGLTSKRSRSLVLGHLPPTVTEISPERRSNRNVCSWSGVTLSMKNIFGVVPGARYGGPKNILHWKGIQESILDLCATVPVHFVIADGIVAMEGNGPSTVRRGRWGRLCLLTIQWLPTQRAYSMGFKPDRVAHIREGSRDQDSLATPHRD